MKEREISLIDLFVELLLKWRVFVILMIVGAVALGAFGYTRSVNNAEAQKTAIAATEQELAEKQLELEKSTEIVENEEEEERHWKHLKQSPEIMFQKLGHSIFL